MRGLLIILLCVSSTVLARDECHDSETTMAMNQCLEQAFDKAETGMERYLSASLKRYENNDEVLDSIHRAQHAWQRYRKHHCESLYSIWIEGTIRGPITWRCLITETQKRRHQLWDSYLRFMDNSKPVLPEPQLP